MLYWYEVLVLYIVSLSVHTLGVNPCKYFLNILLIEIYICMTYKKLNFVTAFFMIITENRLRISCFCSSEVYSVHLRLHRLIRRWELTFLQFDLSGKMSRRKKTQSTLWILCLRLPDLMLNCVCCSSNAYRKPHKPQSVKVKGDKTWFTFPEKTDSIKCIVFVLMNIHLMSKPMGMKTFRIV